MNTVIDFYVEPDYIDFSCADGGVSVESLGKEHDTWVQILKDHAVPNWSYGEIVIEDSVLKVRHRPMDFETHTGGSLDYITFERVVKAFHDNELAAEVLTGLTADSYADLATEDPDHSSVRTFYHALNPDLIAAPFTTLSTRI